MVRTICSSGILIAIAALSIGNVASATTPSSLSADSAHRAAKSSVGIKEKESNSQKKKLKQKREQEKTAAKALATQQRRNRRAWLIGVAASSLVFGACVVSRPWRSFARDGNFHAMLPWRVFVASGVIFVVFAGSALDIALFQEHWPFSNYPMYSRITDSKYITSHEAFGVDQDGQEIDSPSIFRPLVGARLRNVLKNKDQRHRDHHAVANSLLQSHMDAQMALGLNSKIKGIRIYKVRWKIIPTAENKSAPERNLIGEAYLRSAP